MLTSIPHTNTQIGMYCQAFDFGSFVFTLWGKIVQTTATHHLLAEVYITEKDEPWFLPVLSKRLVQVPAHMQVDAMNARALGSYPRDGTQPDVRHARSL